MRNKHRIIFMSMSIALLLFLTLGIIMISLFIANEVANTFGKTQQYINKYNGWRYVTYYVTHNHSFSNAALGVSITSFVLSAILWPLIILFYKKEEAMFPVIKNDRFMSFDAVLYFAPFLSWIFFAYTSSGNVKQKEQKSKGNSFVSEREKRLMIEEKLISGELSPEEFEQEMRSVK